VARWTVLATAGEAGFQWISGPACPDAGQCAADGIRP
jgi:hypothetical protein